MNPFQNTHEAKSRLSSVKTVRWRDSPSFRGAESGRFRTSPWKDELLLSVILLAILALMFFVAIPPWPGRL